MTIDHSDGGSRFEHGIQVRVTIEGTVINRPPNEAGRTIDFFHGSQRVIDAGGYSHWIYPWSEVSKVEVITDPAPAVSPGQVWQTADGLYFARMSRADLSPRMTPADLTEESGLKTVPVEDFFDKYPNAQKVYDPAGSHEAELAFDEDWPVPPLLDPAGAGGGDLTAGLDGTADLGCYTARYRIRH